MRKKRTDPIEDDLAAEMLERQDVLFIAVLEALAHHYKTHARGQGAHMDEVAEAVTRYLTVAEAWADTQPTIQ